MFIAFCSPPEADGSLLFTLPVSNELVYFSYFITSMSVNILLTNLTMGAWSLLGRGTVLVPSKEDTSRVFFTQA